MNVGNFMTMIDAVNRFGADATRFALADSGDSLEDANFDESVANLAILKLTKEEAWLDEVLADTKLRTDEEYTFFDKVFENNLNIAIRETKAHMDNMVFHNALVTGVFELTNHRDAYRTCQQGALHRGLLLRYSKVLALIISPFCPHWAQHIWVKLGNTGFLINEGRFPEYAEEDTLLTLKEKYLQNTVSTVRSNLNRKTLNANKPKKGKAPAVPVVYNAGKIFVALNYAEWQQNVLTLMQKEIKEGKEAKALPRALSKVVTQLPGVKGNKKIIKAAMQFVGFMANEYTKKGIGALDLTLPFDEQKLLTDNLDYVKKVVELEDLVLVDAATPEAAEANLSNPAEPGKPAPFFFIKATEEAPQE